MFKINKYLQFRNTPDGKPRVIVEGIDYKLQDNKMLYITSDIAYFTEYKVGIRRVADLADCRPLLTYDEWTEGDIDFQKKYDIWAIAVYSSLWKSWQKSFFGWNGQRDKTYDTVMLGDVIRTDEKLEKVSFFDDPAKYSKLLWDCSEEEGWQKVFKLLEIDLNNQ